MLLSAETRLGLQLTGKFNYLPPPSLKYTFTNCTFPPIVKSFVELVRFIFTIPGVEVFLSERISQDPLEKFFGCQRQRGRVNENPTVTEFCKNTQKLRVINSVCLDSVKGNCQGKKSTEPIDMEKENRPLPRRKYTKSNKSN